MMQLARSLPVFATRCAPWRKPSQASEKLAGNLKRSGVLHTLISFITLRIMTSKQTAQMSMHT